MKLTVGFVLFKIKIIFLKNCILQRTWKKSAFSNLWSRNLFAWIQKVKDISRAKSNSTVVYKKNREKRLSISFLIILYIVQKIHIYFYFQKDDITNCFMQLQKFFDSILWLQACQCLCTRRKFAHKQFPFPLIQSITQSTQFHPSLNTKIYTYIDLLPFDSRLQIHISLWTLGWGY